MRPSDVELSRGPACRDWLTFVKSRLRMAPMQVVLSANSELIASYSLPTVKEIRQVLRQLEEGRSE